MLSYPIKFRSKNARLQFLDLQLELLDEFRIRLLQLARQDKYQEFFSNRSSPNISPILNTLTAVINVLDDWTDLPVNLQEFLSIYFQVNFLRIFFF